MTMDPTDQRQALQTAYETVSEDGSPYGKTGPRNLYRWRKTLKFLPPDVDSLLDCGCDIGNWMEFVRTKRQHLRLTGIDVSRTRIQEGRAAHPHLDLRVGFAQDLVKTQEKFDAVTALEVLEHIPEWQDVLRAMLALANKVVLITVPYKERIRKTVCIHCGRLTPLYGHLRTYDRSSFPEVDGWTLRLGFIKRIRTDSRRSFFRNVYNRLRVRKRWLVAMYTRS
jgi:hypothetical protein